MNIFQAAHDLFVAHFGAPFRRAPRALDLRGFRMSRREAARWMDALDRFDPNDSHPTRGDILITADREDLLRWARAHRQDAAVWARKDNHEAAQRSRLRAALYISAARGERKEER